MDSSSPFSRKIGRQPVFGRGGMNFDGTSGVEMVTSTTTQFQQTTTSVIRSNNLNEGIIRFLNDTNDLVIDELF